MAAICPGRRPASVSRIVAISSPMASMRSARVLGGRMVDWPRHLTRLHRSLGELRIAAPLGDAALEGIVHEVLRRNRARKRHRLSAGDARRGAPRSCVSGGPRSRLSLVVTARNLDSVAYHRQCGAWRRRGHRSGDPLAQRRYQGGRAAAERARPPGGAGAGCGGGLVRRARTGYVTEGAAEQQLDRDERATADRDDTDRRTRS